MSTIRRYSFPSRLLIPLVPLIAFTTGCQTTVGNYFGNRARDFGECFRLQVGGGFGIGVGISALGIIDPPLAWAATPRKLGFGWVYGDGYAFVLGRTADRWDSEGTMNVYFSPPPVVPLFTPEEAAGLGILLLSPGRIQPSWGIPFPAHWRSDGTSRERLLGRHADHMCRFGLPLLFGRVGDPPDGPQTPEDSAEEAFLQPGGARNWRRVYEKEPQRYAPTIHWRASPRVWSADAIRRNRRAHIHLFDIEVRVHALIMSARAGFSPGEFVDFLLGWFGVDIAGDDRTLKSGEE